MGALDDLAAKNTTRLELTAAMASVGTSTYTAIATSDSSNGAVDVVLSDTVTGNGVDDSVSVELPTTVSVRKGDTVLVTGYGGEVLKSAVVTGDLGGGDRIRDEVDNIASATSQYFWTVDGEEGAHVTNVPQEQFMDDPSGANLLANSNGILLRDGETPLSAFTPSGVTMFDGAGGGTENVVGVFSSNGARVGYYGSSNVTITQNGMSFCDSYGHSVGTIASGTALDTSTVTQPFDPGQMASSQVVTIDFSGVPDFSSGNLSVRVVFYKTQTSVMTSYVNSVSDYGTVMLNDDVYITAAPLTDGWRLTISALVDISSFITWGVFGTYATWSTSAYAPKYEFGGTVSGPYALAANKETIASGKYQTAIGRFNIEDTTDTYALIVGNGSSDSARSDAFTVDWNGGVTCGHVEQDTVHNSITLSNIGSGTKTLYLEREGSIVHASMTATATAGTANAAINCGTIPTGYRPTRNEFQSGVCVSNNTLSGYYRWRVATGGTVTYWCSVTGIRESPLCMTWVTDDAW